MLPRLLCKKKRAFLLIEILISLALMSILLSFLFTAMSRSSHFKAKIDKARSVLIERQHLQIRLQDLFLAIQDASLYTKSLHKEKRESLIAIFDHGIDPDPAFSGPILSRIYLDESHNLCLALWPLEDEKKKLLWRNEILLKNVDDYQFQFLGGKTGKNLVVVNSELAWHSHWSKKQSANPSMIRLLVQSQGVPLSFAFFLASPEPIITYWEEGYQL
jgi:type II secretory pathway pseudopilin PulG